MTREELELITDIRDFTTFIDFILRDFETRDLKCDLRIIIVTSNTLCRVRTG